MAREGVDTIGRGLVGWGDLVGYNTVWNKYQVKKIKCSQRIYIAFTSQEIFL